jgi:hypothetical protein
MAPVIVLHSRRLDWPLANNRFVAVSSGVTELRHECMAETLHTIRHFGAPNTRANGQHDSGSSLTGLRAHVAVCGLKPLHEEGLTLAGTQERRRAPA